MLNVLLLLLVTYGLLKGTNNKGRSRWNNRNSSLTVLDSQLNGNAQTLPVLGSLGNVLTNLLGRQTQRTNLRGKCRRSTNLTTSSAESNYIKTKRAFSNDDDCKVR